ncbi:hypothetical protein BJ973_000096 [Actinoplanes tereljensis]|uniref:Uncharacterized protein n=1 Tax=Paractinoplanes tereljensis TaxID=571912 RepID=A0A919NXY1_9ACTN|nr:hypothetical protein [Actinoplanes tereljensis]GIF26813.1 hypothetical protein Ate02nite_95430 [Actinoplanes tereljensis]
MHERLAPLQTMLVQAGPEVAELLRVSEHERLVGVGNFVAHLDAKSVLRAGVKQSTVTDTCWVLTGSEVFTRLTADRGWDGDAYQNWLAQILAASLLGPVTA